MKIFPGIIVRRHHRSETNGIAERAARRVKEGTSAILLQSGLEEKWWANSIASCCYLRNIQDLLFDGKTPYERRLGVPFNGPVIPFGAMVEFPCSGKDVSRLHQFDSEVSSEYSLDMRCVRKESGKTSWSQTLRNWKRWTHQKSMLGDSTQRNC